MKNRLPRKAKVFARIENKSGGDDSFRISTTGTDRTVSIKVIQIGAGNITSSATRGGHPIDLDASESARIKILVKPKKRDARTVRKMIQAGCRLQDSTASSNAKALLIWKKS